MKTIRIALAAVTLMTSGAMASEISSRYVYGDAPRPSDGNVGGNSTVSTDAYVSGSYVGGTASMKGAESRRRSLIVSPRAEKSANPH